jgi:hypothetical protein
MAAKKKAFGVQLQRKNGAAYDTIPSLLECTPPAESVETIDMTTHDSEDNYREIETTFLNGGTASATFLYDPADAIQAALHTDYAATTKNTYRVVLPGTSPNYRFQFDAFITEWAPGSLATDGRIECSITLTVTGSVTIGNS